MSDKNSKDNENQSYISSHPSIHKKFKNWILNKDKEMMYMKNNNENKKIDVSKVSGGALSIEKKGDNYCLIFKKNMGVFKSEEDAQAAYDDINDIGVYHKLSLYGHHDRPRWLKPEKHMLLLPEDISKDNGK